MLWPTARAGAVLAADDHYFPQAAVTLGLAPSIDEIHQGLLPYSTDFFLVDAGGELRGIYHVLDPAELQRMRVDLRNMNDTTRPSMEASIAFDPIPRLINPTPRRPGSP